MAESSPPTASPGAGEAPAPATARARPPAAPHGAPAAEPEKLPPAAQALLARAQEVLAEFHPQPGALGDLPQLTVAPATIAQVCLRVRDDPRLDLKMLHCLAGVDYLDHFQVVYFLHSLSQESTLVIKADVPAAAPSLPSVTSVWAAADWYEREAHDLFGIGFDGHPDLAPLLLYDGFEGYPGRKEFPFNDYQEF